MTQTPHFRNRLLERRDFLRLGGMVLGGGALTLLLSEHGVLAADDTSIRPAIDPSRPYAPRPQPERLHHLAGGADVKPGFSCGATDELGYRAVVDVTSICDLHATILHLVGFDHERLSFYHNGIERRLTDVPGHVASGILA